MIVHNFPMDVVAKILRSLYQGGGLLEICFLLLLLYQHMKMKI